jgi:hypothetical protein
VVFQQDSGDKLMRDLLIIEFALLLLAMFMAMVMYWIW